MELVDDISEQDYFNDIVAAMTFEPDLARQIMLANRKEVVAVLDVLISNLATFPDRNVTETELR